MPTQPMNVLLTGVTGFLGQAVLERLLSSTDATITCVIRPRGAQSGRARACGDDLAVFLEHHTAQAQIEFARIAQHAA